MANPAYMELFDDQGKKIEGSVNIPGREGMIEVLDFDHEVRILVDLDTGDLTGVRKHETLTFTKAFDSATPYLVKACANGQTLASAKINWYKIDESGKEQVYFTHELKGVKVTTHKPKMWNIKDIDKERYPHLETVGVRYAEITWTYTDGNISFSDSWNSDR